MKRLVIVLVLIGFASHMVFGYAPQSGDAPSVNPKMTPAYELLVLRKVAVETALTDLSSQFTSESSQVINKRFELSLVTLEMDRMQRSERAQVPRLSVTYGNLLLRKVDLEVEFNEMRSQLTSEHPEVKRKRAEIGFLAREIDLLLK